MALSDAYATAATYRGIITKTDTSTDAAILDDLTAVSRYLERRLGRFFTKDAAPVARLYMPKSTGVPLRPDWAESENPWKYGGMSRALYIDDLVSVTSIVIDQGRDGSFVGDAALAATDYELLPRNAALEPEPEPYTTIELTAWGNQWAFPTGCRVQVNGIFGWPAVPKAVERATCWLTGILRLESPRATNRLNELDQIVGASPQAQSIVQELIRNYKRVTF